MMDFEMKANISQRKGDNGSIRLTVSGTTPVKPAAMRLCSCFLFRYPRYAPIKLSMRLEYLFATVLVNKGKIAYNVKTKSTVRPVWYKG